MRYTKDIDILVLPMDIDAMVEVMKPCGFDFDAGIIPFTNNSVRRVTKIVGADYLMLDLLIVNSELVNIWNEQSIMIGEASGFQQ